MLQVKVTRAEQAAQDYLNGNYSSLWKYVGNSATRLLKVHASLGTEGHNIQCAFIYYARKHLEA